jgi:hypothetical protein
LQPALQRIDRNQVAFDQTDRRKPRRPDQLVLKQSA